MSDRENTTTVYGTSLTREYLCVIRDHILAPLETTEVAGHCFASAMLAFAAIDGLGKLLHPDPKAEVGTRFKWFIAKLGEGYAVRTDHLWELRNSLDHNGLNVACFMSQTADAESEHLEYWNGCLFVHTRELTRDLRVAIEAVEADLRQDAGLLSRAESRLTRDYIVPLAWRKPGVRTTPPVAAWFLRQR